MKIFDLRGNERDEEWLFDTYGLVNVRYHDQPAGFEVVELTEREGPANYVVKVLGPDGLPMDRQVVARHWPYREFNPELPPVPEGEWFATAVYGYTDVNGLIGYGTGGGDYYFPQEGQQGASSIWVMEFPSDCIEGLGHLGQTRHRHLDPTFRWVVKDPDPEPEPEPWPEGCQALAELVVSRLDEVIQDCAEVLGAAQAVLSQMT